MACGAATLVLLLLAAAAPAAMAPKPGGAAPATANVAATRRLLEQKIDVDLKGVGLDAALKRVSELVTGLRLVIDPDVAAGGYDLATPVLSLKVRQLPAGTVLDILCRGNLARKTEAGYVLITTRDKSQQNLPLVTYPRPLPPTPSMGDAAQDMSAVADIIMRVVNNMGDPDVAAWSAEGGPAAIEVMQARFVITQTPRGHEAITDLLQQLSRAVGGRPGPAPAESKEVAQTRARLQMKVDLECTRTTLQAVLAQLNDRVPDLNLVVDPPVQAAANRALSKPVDIKVKQVPVASLLGLILGSDLVSSAEAGYVLVADPKTAPRRVALRVYPIAHLLARDPSTAATQAAAVVAVVKQSVNPASDPRVAAWSDEGGPAAACTFSGVLVVTQTADGLDKVAGVLQALKQKDARRP
jgi:hypothetical protein